MASDQKVQAFRPEAIFLNNQGVRTPLKWVSDEVYTPLGVSYS